MIPDPLFHIDPRHHDWTHHPTRCGRGSRKWVPVVRAGTAGTPLTTAARQCEARAARTPAVIPRDIMPGVPGARDAICRRYRRSASRSRADRTRRPRGHAVAWEHVLERIDGGRTRLIVRGRASAHGSISLAHSRRPVTPHLHRARVCAVSASSATPAHRRGDPRPPRHGSAAPARHPETQHGVSNNKSAHRPLAPILLTCGILAPVLYVAMTLLVGLLWEGYSVVSRVPSELSAIGAPRGCCGCGSARSTPS
jgi:hypothetical protein